jgi:hypothetical protein
MPPPAIKNNAAQKFIDWPDHEIGEEFQERMLSRPDLSRLAPFPCGLYGSDVVEVRGDGGAGKSLFLCHLICRALMPMEVGGCEAEVLLIDLDHKIKVCDLHHLLCQRLNGRQSDVDDCLERLLVMPVYDADSFSLCVMQLPTLLKSRRNVSMVAIDSIGAHFHTERLSFSKRRPLFFESFTKKRLKSVLTQLNKFQVCLVYTVQPFARRTTDDKRDDSDRVWPGSLTHRVTITKDDRARKLVLDTRTQHKYTFDYVIRDFCDVQVRCGK